MSGNPSEGQLVSITQYEAGLLGPPLAVGRMAVPGSALRKEERTGKAVYVLHFHKDKMWEMGDKSEPPPPESMPVDLDADENEDREAGPTDVNEGSASPSQPSETALDGETEEIANPEEEKRET